MTRVPLASPLAYAPKTDWHVITSRNDQQLRPLLADVSQPVFKLLFADGSWMGIYRHVPKVVLLDWENRVGNSV